MVPAWPIGKAINSTLSQYLLTAAMRGGYVLLGLFVDLGVATEVHAEADLDDDESSLFSVLATMSRRYRKEWWRLLNSASQTFNLSCRDGRVNTCTCSRSASGMVHHGRQRVALLVPVDRAGAGGGGLAVYMSQ